ncbi:MAG: hypothetical protein HZC02_00415 [Candidatus Levybacteria bacterium]|nr:hypothetical protein [Candidatus Levybacteria bacterium]
MFPGSRVYQEGLIVPEKGAVDGQWHVWCMTGALKVLQSENFRRWLSEDQTRKFQILFVNGAAAKITPGHPLWDELVKIAKEYAVRVFPMNYSGKYVRWRGDSESLEAFDAIIISPIGH